MKYTTLYVYSKERDYITPEYKEFFLKKGIRLKKGNKETLQAFINKKEEFIQLDTETNVTNFYTERELYVIQLGDISNEEQHVIDFVDIEDDIYKILEDLFKSDRVFLAHNGKFEYIVIFKAMGIKIQHFMDTYLMSKIITSGLSLPPGYNGLASIIERIFSIEISKDEQVGFTGEYMSASQILYATIDVMFLYKIYKQLITSVERWKLQTILKIENKCICPIGDMTINGFLVDTNILDENIVIYNTDITEKYNEMTSYLTSDELKESEKEKILDLNVIQKEDEIIINWNSTTQKKLILNHLYPEENITSTAKKMLEKLEDKVENPTYIKLLLNGSTDKLEDILISRHLQFLMDNKMFIKKGSININFNSNQQVLDLFKIWYPSLTSVGVKALKRLRHPLIDLYKKYIKIQKLASSFGEKMYEYIEPDSKIHANFNQLVPTGSRMSSNNPNMQQAPSTVQYRKMFIPDKGYKLVDSDYSSAELYIAAYLSNDKQMLKAIENGYDMHSYSASLIFGQKWLDAGGEAEPKGKPKTKEAGDMRKKSKGLSFSLLYGTGVVNFSENNGVSRSEGKELMETYYKTFPELAAFFKQSGEDALKRRYIKEPYFGRTRFFNKPTNGMEVSHLKNAAMNYRPQSVNGTIMKLALILVYQYIQENNLEDHIKILLVVHDQLVTAVNKDIEDWAEKQTFFMEKAAKYAIKAGTLKAESEILTHWKK